MSAHSEHHAEYFNTNASRDEAGPGSRGRQEDECGQDDQPSRQEQ
jgi:hypothetical protein